MTTGAAQTLLRGYGTVPGRRVLLAGNGPLNLQVAVELARHGADVAAVAELAQQPGVWALPALGGMASATPGLLCNGLMLTRELRRRGIPVLYGHTVRSIDRDAESLAVRLGNGRAYHDPGREFHVDVVCMGYGFLPANELARGLDCRHTYDHTRHSLITERSDDCETSVASVFAVGDCCGLGGARAAMEEGLIAGTAAAAALGRAVPTALLAECSSARRRLRRHRQFQKELWHLFRAPRLHLELATPDTVICRCESVTLAQIEAVLADGRPSLSEVKRRTRLGMGGCQGRTCAPLAAALLTERQGRPLNEMAFFAPRMPVRPIHIGLLSRR
jgi:NAD(P)H-nitrite reductase large subunit